MRKFITHPLLAAWLLGSVAIANPAVAETAAQTHMGHVSTAWGDTPDGQGLLPTALAEAEIAAYHASVGASEPGNLEWMQTHALHVLHAATGEGEGPGLGYGVAAAAEGAAYHIGIAAADDSASDNIEIHAEHVSTSANNVVVWVAGIETLVGQIQAAGNAAEAAPLAAELQLVAAALTAGIDADGNGDITWEEGEGGLQAATYHMGIMFEGEGL